MQYCDLKCAESPKGAEREKLDSVIYLQGCFSGEKTDDRAIYLQKYLFVALCPLTMSNEIHSSVKSQTRSGEQMLSAFCRTESIFIYHDQSDRL